MATLRPVRVLFVCLGNAYRSQMAEGFANRLGRDVLAAESAGLTPVDRVPETTLNVMREKGIDISAQFPKAAGEMDLRSYDLVVNMAGLAIPGVPPASARTWIVPDPVGASERVAREVRDEIESLVMGLILELRKQRAGEEKPRLRPKLRGV
jgi:arsenate reductase